MANPATRYASSNGWRATCDKTATIHAAMIQMEKAAKNHAHYTLDQSFSFYLVQLLKDGVDTHFNKDPLAAIALTFNGIELFQNRLSYLEMECVLGEMQKHWTALNCGKSEDHVLFTLAKLLTETHLLEGPNTLIRKMPLLKLCAFLYCQAPFQDSKINVYPRKNESSPFF